MREAIKDKLKSIHIIEACDRIDSYYPNKEIPILDAKSIEFFGLAKNLEIIGEALNSALRIHHTFWQPVKDSSI